VRPSRRSGPVVRPISTTLHGREASAVQVHWLGEKYASGEGHDGRARKVSGFAKPRDEWNVLLRNNHPGYIGWQEFEDNQKLLLENAHMKKNCARKSARGGRALLTGLMRCGRMWANDARLLRHGQRQRSSLAVPQR
jgi:hypothetical protein